MTTPSFYQLTKTQAAHFNEYYKNPTKKNVIVNYRFNLIITCEIVGFLDDTYGKFEDWMFDTMVIMEYNEFYPF